LRGSLLINDIVRPTRDGSTFVVSAVGDQDIEWFIIGCRVEFNEDVTLIDDASGAAANKECDENESCCCGFCWLENEFDGRVGGTMACVSVSFMVNIGRIPLAVRWIGA
jgi:hypothetical protein